MKPFLIIIGILLALALVGYLVYKKRKEETDALDVSTTNPTGLNQPVGPLTYNQTLWTTNTYGKATTKEECDKRMRGICGGFPGISTERRWWWLGCVCDTYDTYCDYPH